MTFPRLDLKATLATDEAGIVTGLAWPFGMADRYGDVIEPGAFKSAKPPLPMLAFHDATSPVGAWSEIAETAKGLQVKGKLLVDEVARAKELRALVAAGAVTGLSIGFITKTATARAGGGRTIKALELVEISFVTVPAHPGARVTSAKSAAEAIRLAAAINSATAALRA